MEYGPKFRIEIPGKYMGDVGSVTSAVAKTRAGWDYVIPVYNRIWRFTTQKRCLDTWDNHDVCMIGAPGEDYDPPYDPDGYPEPGCPDEITIDDSSYCEDDPCVPNPPEVEPRLERCEEGCCCTSAASGVCVDPDDPYAPSSADLGCGPNYCYEDDPLLITDYTTDNGLSGKYYYNIVDLVCFRVDEVNTSGPVKWIKGCVVDTCSARCLAGEPWEPGDTGPLSIKLID